MKNWSVVKWSVGHESINVEIEEAPSTTKYTTLRYYEQQRIKEALRRGCTVKQYKNFLEIDGHIYNGWSLEMVDNIIEKPSQRDIDEALRDIEWEN